MNHALARVVKNTNNAMEKLYKRCSWLPLNNVLYCKYHDEEWGVPVHDDQVLFEFLILESAQAGLSWSTILNKRENYRKAFDNFNIKKVSNYNNQKIQELLQNSGIIRNKLKIISAIKNAKSFLKIQEEKDSFSNYLWSFVDYKPLNNHWRSSSDIPSKTILSDLISKDLKKRGMSFIGSTIIYAYLQAIGVINDHEIDCFRNVRLNS